MCLNSIILETALKIEIATVFYCTTLKRPTHCSPLHWLYNGFSSVPCHQKAKDINALFFLYIPMMII